MWGTESLSVYHFVPVGWVWVCGCVRSVVGVGVSVCLVGRPPCVVNGGS